MTKAPKKTLHKSALSGKTPGPASYHHTHPMARLSKELPRKAKVNPARKGTRKSGKA
jgi:hypothetical protein